MRTIGNPVLSAWQVAPGVTWIQTRSPEFARDLARRSDSRRVLHAVKGGYLRTFEFPHGLNWAKQLIARYTPNGTASNEHFFNRAAPPRPRKPGRTPRRRTGDADPAQVKLALKSD
jgi:hypothetical protein